MLQNTKTIKHKKASEAESLVAQALANQGWHILAKNFRIVGAELDIVAQKGGTVAVVEVKARVRKPNSMADLETLLPQRKKNALQRGGVCYLAKLPLNPQCIRFDLAIVWGKAPPYSIDYFVSVI